MSAFRHWKRLFLAGWFVTGWASFSFASEDFDEAKLRQWHQWRGPLANGTALHGDPPLRWSETENVRWKSEIPGLGNSTPIVWEDRVFILSAVETEQAVDPDEYAAILEANAGQLTEPPATVLGYVVLAYDRQTGELRWQKTARESLPHEGRHKTNTFASASPVTDGTRLYVSFGSPGIYAYDFAGNLHWECDLGTMRTRKGWGEGASPALGRQGLFVNWDQEEQSFLVALDKRTGQEIWRVDRDEPTSWSTPLVVEHEGREQVVVSATNRVIGYDAETGKVLWECEGLTTNVIPSPVRHGGNVICMSWYGESSVLAIPLSAQGRVQDRAQLAWTFDVLAPYCPSPLLYDELLYFTRANSNVLTCLDADTGETVIPVRRLPLEGDLYASPVGAAGRVYVTSRNGETAVLQHGPMWEEPVVNSLDDGFDASPAIVGSQLFLRGHRYLYCLEAEAASAP